jgi:hypothetical protein
MACLSPPLEAVPAGSWYCPPCRLLSNTNQNMREVIDVEVRDGLLLAPGGVLPGNGCQIS